MLTDGPETDREIIAGKGPYRRRLTKPPDLPLFGQRAFEAAKLFVAGSRIPSGPADMVPHRQAAHVLAIDRPVKILNEALASDGPFTNAR